MKKRKQIGAIIALVCIALLLVGFIISAFTTTAASKNLFYAFFFAIIAIPILAWILIFCIGRMKGKHTMAELFPEDETINSSADSISEDQEATTQSSDKQK